MAVVSPKERHYIRKRRDEQRKAVQKRESQKLSSRSVGARAGTAVKKPLPAAERPSSSYPPGLQPLSDNTRPPSSRIKSNEQVQRSKMPFQEQSMPVIEYASPTTSSPVSLLLSKNRLSSWEEWRNGNPERVEENDDIAAEPSHCVNTYRSSTQEREHRITTIDHNNTPQHTATMTGSLHPGGERHRDHFGNHYRTPGTNPASSSLTEKERLLIKARNELKEALVAARGGVGDHSTIIASTKRRRLPHGEKLRRRHADGDDGARKQRLLAETNAKPLGKRTRDFPRLSSNYSACSPGKDISRPRLDWQRNSPGRECLDYALFDGQGYEPQSDNVQNHGSVSSRAAIFEKDFKQGLSEIAAQREDIRSGSYAPLSNISANPAVCGKQTLSHAQDPTVPKKRYVAEEGMSFSVNNDDDDEGLVAAIPPVRRKRRPDLDQYSSRHGHSPLSQPGQDGVEEAAPGRDHAHVAATRHADQPEHRYNSTARTALFGWEESRAKTNIPRAFQHRPKQIYQNPWSGAPQLSSQPSPKVSPSFFHSILSHVRAVYHIIADTILFLVVLLVIWYAFLNTPSLYYEQLSTKSRILAQCSNPGGGGSSSSSSSSSNNPFVNCTVSSASTPAGWREADRTLWCLLPKDARIAEKEDGDNGNGMHWSSLLNAWADLHDDDTTASFNVLGMLNDDYSGANTTIPRGTLFMDPSRRSLLYNLHISLSHATFHYPLLLQLSSLTRPLDAWVAQILHLNATLSKTTSRSTSYRGLHHSLLAIETFVQKENATLTRYHDLATRIRGNIKRVKLELEWAERWRRMINFMPGAERESIVATASVPPLLPKDLRRERSKVERIWALTGRGQSGVQGIGAKIAMQAAGEGKQQDKEACWEWVLGWKAGLDMLGTSSVFASRKG